MAFNYPFTSKYDRKRFSAIKYDNDNYTNKKLQSRLRAIIFSKGLTEYQVSQMLGIKLITLQMVMRGIRKPSHGFVYRLMEVLGDEIQMLFYSYYQSEPFPKLIPANEFIADPHIKAMQEHVAEVLERKGKFRYFNR